MFEFKENRRNIPNDELLEDVKNTVKKLNAESITAENYTKHGQFSSRVLVRRFQSWHAVLKLCNLPENRTPMNVPNEELFNNLLNIWQKLGKQPSSKNLKNYGSIYSRNLYENKFGSWNNALKAFIDHINNNNLNVSSFDKAESKVIASNRTPRDINWRLRAKILIRDNCICQMCGASPAKKPDVELHVDHIYPYSKGGETVEENLRTLCIQCNIGKSDMVIEYIANRG